MTDRVLYATSGILIAMLTLTAPLARADDIDRRIRFDGRSGLERIFVVDEGDLRYLRFGSAEGDDQTVISLTDERSVPVEYIQTAGLGFVLCGACHRLMMIGLGGGAFTTLARRLYPLSWLDAVEIDPVVVEVAERFFGVERDERFVIHVADGGAFVDGIATPYDLVMLDAYSAEDPPPALITETFFRKVAAGLTADGVVILNLSVDEDIEQLVSERFARVFAHCGRVRTLDESNLVLVGRRSPWPADLAATAARFADERELGFDLAAIAGRIQPICP